MQRPVAEHAGQQFGVECEVGILSPDGKLDIAVPKVPVIIVELNGLVVL